MYLIVKLDAPGMGKHEVTEHIKAELAHGYFRSKAPLCDIEVISVVAATPKRLARVGEAMKERK